MAWGAQVYPARRSNRRVTAILAALAATSVVLVPRGDVLSATTTTFTATADSFVNKKEPSANVGTRSTIRAEGSPIIRSYIRFTVGNLTAPVTRAVLRVYPKDSNAQGFAVASAASSSWAEKTITWNNAPAVGTTVASSGSVTANRSYDLDVTSLVPGNGTYTFVLTSSSGSGIRFASREAGSNGPRLVIETSASPTTTTTTPTPTTTTSQPPPSGSPVLVAAGDIACPTWNSSYKGGAGTATACRQRATSDLALALDPDVVATLGDMQYDAGALDQFNASYGASWGRLKDRTRPTPGNHEYQDDQSATGYYTYFGAAAGNPAKGYYSYNIGSWHVVVLNSNCARVGGCNAGSPQEQWLRADLAANPAACTLAYFHHPRFSSGQHAGTSSVSAFWQALYSGGADVVLNGHDHHYERFAPQNPSGQFDQSRGIRQFLVGSGGKDHYSLGSVAVNSERRNNTAFGVLALTLHDGSYDWRFVAEAGATFTDSGTGSCH